MNDEKVNVASLVYSLYPNDARVRRQAEVLARNGCDVDVFTLRTESGCSSFRLGGVNVYQLPLEKKRGGILRYIFQYAAFGLLGFCWVTYHYIRKRYKVIHVNNMPNIIVYCALIPKLCGAKIILDIHDPFPELYASGSGPEKSGGIVYRLFCAEERMSTAFADHVICTTDLIQNAVVERGARRSKTSVVRNAPDAKLFNRRGGDRVPPSAKGRFNVLYAGTVVERYGVTNILKALNAVKDKVPGLTFTVMGLGDGIPVLRALAKAIDAEGILNIQPARPVDEVPLEYEKADAILWFPQRNEFIDIILCVKVMEALAMGIPVISTRTRSHEYYFSKGEVAFVDSLEPVDLGEAVLDLYRNYDRRVPLTAETDAYVEEFGWESEKMRYLSLIESLIPASAKRKPARSVEYG